MTICRICQKSIKNISDHLINTHSQPARRYRKKESGHIFKETSTDETMGKKIPVRIQNKHDNAPANYLSRDRSKQYLDIIQQISFLDFHAKQQYILQKASSAIIETLRECVLNAHMGNVNLPPLKRSLKDDLRAYQRLLSLNIGTQELRYHLSKRKTLQYLTKIIPHLLNFLNARN